MQNKNFQEKWQQLLCPMRYGNKQALEELCNENYIDKARSPFIQDHDRIIFSDSFRRLAGKTQVHPLSTNDHVHTRLAHSLEVASVGRGLGTQYGYFLAEKGDLPPFIEPYHLGEIVQSACLAHDIGNPPFGHAGEFAIQEWFNDKNNNEFTEDLGEKIKDFQFFDGNAQGFRVINVVENDRQQGGFKLTYPTLASVVKYPHNAQQAEKIGKKKYNYFFSEEKIFQEIFQTLGLLNNKENPLYLRHPLSYLMEASDDICYRIIDMEDARELGILRYEEIQEVLKPIWDLMNLDTVRMREMYSDRARMSYLRSHVIGVLVQDILAVSKKYYEKLMQGENILPYMDLASEPIKAYMKNAKDCFYNVILSDPKKTCLEIGSYSVYKCLLDAFIPAVFMYIKQNKKMVYRDSRIISLMGVHKPCENASIYDAYHTVIDFITGMTDSYATFIASQFAGNGQKI